MDTVVRIFAGIADDLNCTFELVHHTRKLVPGRHRLTASSTGAALGVHGRRAICAY